MKTRTAPETGAPPDEDTHAAPRPRAGRLASAPSRPAAPAKSPKPRRSRSARAGAPSAGGPPPPRTGPLYVAENGALIGREDELAHLHELWRQAQSGRARTVLIAGGPGTGKTRLAAELADTVSLSDSGLVLAGACRRDAPLPYEPFVEALAPTLAACPRAWLDDHVARHGAGLARLFPSIAARLDGEAAEPLVTQRTRLLGALSAAVTDLGDEPVLLVLEDLQWATPSTVLTLSHLVRHATASRLLVVGTYREEAVNPSHPLHAFIADPSLPPVERIVLADLPARDVAAVLVDRAAVAGPNAAALALALWTTTEGNPLVLTEVVRDLAARGLLAGGSVKSKVADSVGGMRDVAAIVAHRLRRASSAVKEAVDAAAVIGGTFSAATVAHLCNAKEDDARDALRKAVDATVLVTAGGGDADADRDRFAFLHEAVRDAVLDALAPNRAVRLQHSLVELLERPGGAVPAVPAVLVHHHAEAAPVGRSPEAVQWARRAGDAAMAVLAYEEAASQFGQGLAFLGTGGVSGTRVDLLMLLGDAYHKAGEEARSRQAYLQAAQSAEQLRDGPRLAHATLGLGEVLGVWGNDKLLIGLLDQALTINGDGADPGLRARLVARLAQARAKVDGPDQRKAQSDTAWELAWDSRDPETMGAVLRSRHEALTAPDDLEDRVEIDGELFAMANNAKDPELLLLAHGWRLVDLLEQGHLVDADRDRKWHADLAKSSGDPRHKRDAELWAASFALVEGKPRRANPHIDKALALGHHARDAGAASAYWLQQLALIDDWGSQGDLDELIDVWGDLVASHDGAAFWRGQRALLLLRAGRAGDAAAELDDLLHDGCSAIPLDRDWVTTVCAAVEVAAGIGDERAPIAARLLSPYSRRFVVLGGGLAVRGPVARVIGQAAASAGNWAGAERQFQAALSAAERVNSAPMTARARADFGRALAGKHGGPLHVGRVEQILEQAAEEADALGMARLADETRDALAQISG